MPQISLSPDNAEGLRPSRRRGRTVAAIVVVGAMLVAGQAGFGRSGSHRSVKVEWGDSLWALSQRYGVDMEQLAAANHMKVSDVLLAGRTLSLPGGASRSCRPAAPPRQSGHQGRHQGGHQGRRRERRLAIG